MTENEVAEVKANELIGQDVTYAELYLKDYTDSERERVCESLRQKLNNELNNKIKEDNGNGFEQTDR